MRRRLVVAAMVVASLLAGACGTDATKTVAPATTPQPTATPEPSSTPEPTATSEPNTVPEPTASREPTAIPQPAGVELLVAHADGIDLWSDGTTTPVLTGRPIAIALPDLQGGIVFQEEGEGPVPVEWLETPGTDPVTLVASSDSFYLGIDSTLTVGSTPTLLYLRGRTLPNDCDPNGPPDCRWDFDRLLLVARDLVANSERNLGVIGSFESSTVQYSIGGDVASFVYSPYGEPWSCVGVVDSSLLLDGAEDRWIGEGAEWLRQDARWLLQGECGFDEPVACDEVLCSIRHVAATAPDGSTVAVVFSNSPTDAALATEPLTLLIVDPVDGSELRRIEIDPPATRPLWIDFDGENIAVGRATASLGEPLAPVLVEPDGTITEFTPGDRLAIVRS